MSRLNSCATLAVLMMGVTPITSAWAAPAFALQEGEIVSSQSRWGYGRTAIVSESVLQRPDGSQVTIHQLGGSLGGLTMRVSHSPVLLQLGDQVSVETSASLSLAGLSFHQLVNVRSRRQAVKKDAENSTHEFVRASNTDGTAIFWKSGCAFINTAMEGSEQIAGTTEFDVIDDVLKSWQDGTRSCSQFELINDGPLDAEVGLDGINLIKFRESRWCRPATEDDPEKCHDEAAAGITTIFFNNKNSPGVDGSIVDADIELNSVNFAFAVNGQSGGDQQCQSDLANTLAHEMGHFLGLSHTCRLPNDPASDPFGVNIPLCTSVSNDLEITDATMYNFQRCAETKKATLEADDIAGMCAIYPTIDHPDECKRATIGTTGCCSVAGKNTPKTPFGALALVVFPVILLIRRSTN